jgi:IS30 family transposase
MKSISSLLFPYASWDRFTNENMKELASQYIPNNRNLSSTANDDL